MGLEEYRDRIEALGKKFTVLSNESKLNIIFFLVSSQHIGMIPGSVLIVEGMVQEEFDKIK